MTYWVDVFEDIVDAVRADTDNPCTDTDEPFYMHGHPLEVINLLAKKDRSKTHKFNKYPLIALFQDFAETIGEDPKIQSTATLNIIIATQTSPDYTAAQRYDNTFKTILYPLYELLLKHIQQSGWFHNVSQGIYEHTKYDRLFWGRQGLQGNDGLIFMDHIDAIEITDLSLAMKQRKSCT